MSDDFWRETFFDCSAIEGVDLERLEGYGDTLAWWQRGINWWIGDMARYAEARWPDRWNQIFPPWMSPGQINRCKAVATAYPQPEDRNLMATWSQHAMVANKPDRINLVAEMVAKGQTTDESRQEQQEAKPAQPASRWLLVVDTHYYINRYWHIREAPETARDVANWIERTVSRLRAKGLTDLACCFESEHNNRKDLTADWDESDRYKGNRSPKPLQLVEQIGMTRKILEDKGVCCVSIPGFEADDCIASYAKQFKGKVAILSDDKDLRQCLSDTTIIMEGVKWEKDRSSGQLVDHYNWLSARPHSRLQCDNLFDKTGLLPSQYLEMQVLAGDSTDNVKGASNVGEVNATEYIKQFGSAEATIQAAKDFDERITKGRRQSLIEFEGKLATTRQLVTLRTDLPVPQTTRIP